MIGDQPVWSALSTLRVWTWWAAVWIGAGLGLAAYQIGDVAHEFNILAPPALALILWSGFAYLLIVLRSLFGGKLAEGGHTLARMLHDWLSRRGYNISNPDASSLQPEVAWISAHLHLFAAGIAAGVVAGIYVRGLVVEYRAVWESTFLQADQVARLLAVLLGPASLVTGIKLPEAGEIELLRSGGSAATWLHLWATTVILFCLLPRLALVAWFWMAVNRAASKRSVTQAEPPCDLKPLAIIAYCLPGGVTRAENLADELTAPLGAKNRPHVLGSITYGEEESVVSLLDSANDARIAILVGIGTTPEAETHGTLASIIAATRHDLTVVLDTDEWSRRGFDEAARLDARVEAWRQILPDLVSVVVIGSKWSDSGTITR